MEHQPAPVGHLFCLPPGTRVQDWLLLGCHGHGGFDVYALGVTAYRLVTGQYPPGPELRQDDQGAWRPVEAPLPAPRELEPRVDPQLSALILRMLSVSPEERGTAGGLAQVLEAAAEQGQAVPTPIQPWKQWGRARMIAGALLVLWTLLAVHAPHPSASARKQVASNAAPPREGGASMVGESASAATQPWGREFSKPEALSQDTPPKPLPGQVTPDAKGQCPGRTQIPINGGCWVEQKMKDAEACEENGYVFFKARCYAPALKSRRRLPPTAAPPDFQ